MATAILFAAAASNPQHLLLVAPIISPVMILPSVEAFVPGGNRNTVSNLRSNRIVARKRRRPLHWNARCCQPNKVRSCSREPTKAHCGETSNKNGEGNEPETVVGHGSTFSDRAAATRAWKSGGAVILIILSAVLAVAAPMPALAEWETGAAMAPCSTVVAVVLESPYTGQLVDTSGANLVRLNSGVTYNDLREGTGEMIASEGKRVNIQWSLKRSNGYSIDSSAQNEGIPFIFVVGAGTTQQQEGSSGTETTTTTTTKETTRAIPGLDEGIRGMKVGGIRRIVIPPSLAYVGGLGETDPGPIPPGFGPKQRIKRVMENRMDVPDESFLLDVKLTRVQ